MRLKSGFTLVELAIVIVIIGLLVGGVLQGQELIKQAKIRAVIAQLREYDTAINTFRAKYDNSIPGDFDKATVFGIGDNLAEETTGNFDPALTDGNNNKVLEAYPAGNTLDFAWELKNLFVMLSNAGLVKGSFNQSTLNANIRSAYPEVATGGGMIVVSSNNSLYYLLAATASYASGDPAPSIDEGALDGGFLSHILTPEEAYSIDSKLDDGKPTLGNTKTFWAYNGNNAIPSFVQYNSGSNCASTDNDNDPNTNYILSNNNKACMIYVKASN
jgi:prepilin-type N-terminal cleavage/methylation domain-containing protein